MRLFIEAPPRPWRPSEKTGHSIRDKKIYSELRDRDFFLLSSVLQNDSVRKAHTAATGASSSNLFSILSAMP